MCSVAWRCIPGRGLSLNQTGMDGESVDGLVGSSTGGRGAWLKSKSWTMLPRTRRPRARRAGVGSTVGLGVEPGPAEEVVLDELEIGVARERLVVDVAPLRVGRDDHGGTRSAVAVLVDRGGHTLS